MKLKLTALFLFVVITIALSNVAFAAPHDEVVFPDANLKKALLDEGVDSNDDGIITEEVPEAADVTGDSSM